MKAIFKTNVSFILPYTFFFILGALLLAIKTKSETHLVFNTIHSTFFDTFFLYATYLGDGIMSLLAVIILLAVKYRYALIVGISGLIASIIGQTLKQTVFNEIVRPKKFFDGIHELYLVPGVENHLFYSFPSGHSICAFSLYFALALVITNKVLKGILFFVALLAGYSRIYLSQHFFEDVYAGSVIGMFTTFIVYYSIQKSNKNWLDGCLITSFKSS